MSKRVLIPAAFLLRALGLTVFLLAVPSNPPATGCAPTPQRAQGTHYEPVTKQAIDVSRGLLVRGRVLAAPDCAPVANAKVAHWQAGLDGEYRYDLRAFLYTDHEGRYDFETEWPNLSPPHIHFMVEAEGYRTLVTQWVGDDRRTLVEFDIVLSRED